jgi:hypothetical protein
MIAVDGWLDQAGAALIISARQEKLSEAGMGSPQRQWRGRGRRRRRFGGTHVARDGITHELSQFVVCHASSST